MKIEWKGHASFLFTGKNGVRLLTDPFNEAVGYPLPNVMADVVTVSHQHFDHNSSGLLPGNPVVIDTLGEHLISGIKITGIPTFHDEDRGAKRGKNTVYLIEFEGIKVCHLGDLGHMLEHGQVEAIGPIDVLCIPVGGFYTIDASQAIKTVQQLKPAIVLPMHYKLNEQVKLPIEPVDDFLGSSTYVKKARELELPADLQQGETITVVFEL